MVVVVGGRRSSRKRSMGKPESVACRGPPRASSIQIQGSSSGAFRSEQHLPRALPAIGTSGRQHAVNSKKQTARSK